MNTQLNYHHLRYFLAVAEAGGVSAAARELHVSSAALSSQISELEQFLERPLFVREHRRMHLSEVGRVVKRYAERIYLLGDEMLEVISRGALGAERTLLGVTDSVPKFIVSEILGSALGRMPTLRVQVREGLPAELIPALVAHQLDVVISNEPAPPSLRTALYTTNIGSFEIAFMATPELLARFNAFKGLDEFPILVPTRESPLRRHLDSQWHAAGIKPDIIGEFDDTATMFELAAAGTGAVPVFSKVSASVETRYGMVQLPLQPRLKEDLFVITPERQFQQTGTAIVVESAKAIETNQDSGE